MKPTAGTQAKGSNTQMQNKGHTRKIHQGQQKNYEPAAEKFQTPDQQNGILNYTVT